MNQDQLAKLRTQLITLLNKRRTQNNIPMLNRCRRGDSASQQLINSQVTSTQSNSFSQIMQANNVVAQTFGILYFEYIHQQYISMPIEQEALEGFKLAFEEFLNSARGSNLLSQSPFTNISLGFQQSGMNQETF